MAITVGQRITVIRECAHLLDKYEWGEIDFILSQFGAPTSNNAHGGKSEYVLDMLKGEKEATIVGLHSYLTQQADGSRPGDSPWTSDRLRLFCSHLATERTHVGEVSRGLERFGIEPFVAHDSIEPSKEWQAVIEAGLQDCDVMVVFLHQGFLASKWCDQEVGWAMGRHIPVLPLNYGAHPHGFLAKLQDQPCVGKAEPFIARDVAAWASKVPALKGRMAASLSYAFERSVSWNHTRTLVPMLDSVDVFNDDELDALERAAVVNTQVRDCDVFGTPGPTWVTSFVRQRRKPVASPGWSDEPPF